MTCLSWSDIQQGLVDKLLCSLSQSTPATNSRSERSETESRYACRSSSVPGGVARVSRKSQASAELGGNDVLVCCEEDEPSPPGRQPARNMIEREKLYFCKLIQLEIHIDSLNEQERYCRINLYIEAYLPAALMDRGQLEHGRGWELPECLIGIAFCLTDMLKLGLVKQNAIFDRITHRW